MMNKSELMNFLRNEQKLMNVCFYCNDFEFADRLLKFIDSLPNGEASRVSENEDDGKECTFIAGMNMSKECEKYMECSDGCKYYK